MTEVITSVLLSTYTVGCVLVLMLAMAATIGALVWGITECILFSKRRIEHTLYKLYDAKYLYAAMKHYTKIKPYNKNKE